MIIGFGNVALLVWNNTGLDTARMTLTIVAGIVASIFYGAGGKYTKTYTHGIGSLAIALGVQIAAALVLLPGAIGIWPEDPVSVKAWAAVIVLGVFCTGIAYGLYYRLIANARPAISITVSYLIPGFAMFWCAIVEYGNRPCCHPVGHSSGGRNVESAQTGYN